MTTKDYQKKSVLRIFLGFFRNHRKLFLLDMGCALLASLIDLFYPLVTRHALNELLPVNAYRAFFVAMAVLVAAFVLRAILFYVVSYWGHMFGVRVEGDIRRALFSHMQTLDFDFFGKNRTGQLMSRMTSDLFDITELAHHGPEDLFISLITVAGALVVMSTIQWRLALVVAVILPIFFCVVMLRRRAMARASRLLKQQTGEINAGIESNLSGMRTAKAFANETVEKGKFVQADKRYQQCRGGFYREMAKFHSTMELFLCVLIAAVLAAGGWLIMKGRMDYVDLITFNLYIATFTTPLRKLSSFSELFAGGFAGLQRFVQIMRTEPGISDAPDAVELTEVKGEIAVEDVSFTYTGKTEVLQDVDFRIRAGETVAVVGPSGGGKTTLCQLIPRFYDVTRGAITVDGTDVRKLTQQSLRRSIGIVQQDVFLFADSVLENIRYGRPDATPEEVREAARRAEIYDDIMAMPQGFDTYVGERGVRLSGGQKQRIAIARIFLKDPPILILDEATSALDSVTEARIQSAFDELAKGRTTLIIAHRLSTIRSADRILVISEGELKEMGSHGELMEKNGIYAELYNTQIKLG